MTKQIRRSNDHFACKKKIKIKKTKINNISLAKIKKPRKFYTHFAARWLTKELAKEF